MAKISAFLIGLWFGLFSVLWLGTVALFILKLSLLVLGLSAWSEGMNFLVLSLIVYAISIALTRKLFGDAWKYGRKIGKKIPVI